MELPNGQGKQGNYFFKDKPTTEAQFGKTVYKRNGNTITYYDTSKNAWETRLWIVKKNLFNINNRSIMKERKIWMNNKMELEKEYKKIEMLEK